MHKTRIVASTDPYITLFPAKRDPDWQHTRAALGQLFAARFCRQKWNDTLRAAIKKYGELQAGQSHISGIYADHFPEPTKNALRQYARDITTHTDVAMQEWQKAGRRLHTFRELVQIYRRLNDGTVSYY